MSKLPLDYETLAAHWGHKIEIGNYGGGDNYAIECMDCYEVLYSVNRPGSSDEDEEE